MALNLIPNAQQSLDETRDPIKNNFINIDSGFSLNHVELNTGPNSGKHKFLQMPSQLAVDPATAPAELALYAKNGTVGTQMFIRQENNGPVTEFTYALKATDGWTQLPSGIIIQWGSINLVGATAPGTIVTFPRAFSVPALNVQVTMNQSVGGQSRVAYVVTDSLTTTNFLAAAKNSQSNNRNDGTVFWFAIGY